MGDLQSAQPLTLKCGLTLPNRLIKAAMAETLANSDKGPNKKHLSLYGEWAKGGWGMVLTGHVQVDSQHMGARGDVCIDDVVDAPSIPEKWKQYASTIQQHGTPAVVQLNHPGRQSPMGAGGRGLFAKTMSSSAVPVSLGDGIIAWLMQVLLFGTPREMTVADIRTVVKQFASAARAVANSGFSGVEIHAAHGYLLTQFLSSKINKRTDDYGGTAAKRACIVLEIIKAIKEAVPDQGFALGIKLNSVDHQSKEDLADCVEQLRLIVDAGVDFVEISGGTAEDPKMLYSVDAPEQTPNPGSRTQAREAFFLEFAQTIRSQFKDVPLMVTGGFKSRNGIEAAISNGDCDLVGLGRPSVINPLLPETIIFNKEISNDDATLYRKTIPIPWIVKQIGIRAVGIGAQNNMKQKAHKTWQHSIPGVLN
ncbi:NADH oxidase 3 [Paramyrothecium foliicola]|nr:NADH oxidase 3 [Paramyrothecium foliicola]